MKLLVLLGRILAQAIMAFIPDSAIRAGREVSLSAKALYAVYCSHRDPISGLAHVSEECALEEAGISRRTFFEAKKELRACEWIEETAGGSIQCLKGREEFIPVENSADSALDPVENSADSALSINMNARARARVSPHYTTHDLYTFKALCRAVHDFPVENSADSALSANSALFSTGQAAVELFTEVFGLAPTDQHAQLIHDTVTDLLQWSETLNYWKRAGHKVTSVERMLDNYTHHVKERQRAYIGQSKNGAHAAPAQKEGNLQNLARVIQEDCLRTGREPEQWERNVINEAREE